RSQESGVRRKKKEGGGRRKEEEIPVLFREFCTSFNPHYTIVILIIKINIPDFLVKSGISILTIII
ncbi:hypothetical protein MEN41_18750, partial [Dolichospermum sp. ST_con]|nr:hypothetical protein [Dolichospermum sp. ST_con]